MHSRRLSRVSSLSFLLTRFSSVSLSLSTSLYLVGSLCLSREVVTCGGATEDRQSVREEGREGEMGEKGVVRGEKEREQPSQSRKARGRGGGGEGRGGGGRAAPARTESTAVRRRTGEVPLEITAG